MKLSLVFVLSCILGFCYGVTVDVSPYVFRIRRSPQDNPVNNRIFTDNNQVNSAAAGALLGGLLSFTQNQVFNPCTRTANRNKNTNNRIFGSGVDLGSLAAGALAGYGGSQLATTFLNGCG